MKDAVSLPKTFRDWWREFAPDQEGGDEEGGEARQRPRDLAVFARLRRAATPEQALLEPAVFRLLERLDISAEETERSPRRALAAGTAAAVLAHVRRDLPDLRFATQLGRTRDGKTTKEASERLLSPRRFAQMMSAEPGPAQLASWRRAVAITRGVGDVGDIGSALMSWGERTRVNWTFRYYGSAAPVSPQAVSTSNAMNNESDQ
ncbi:MAG: type I-E CRISPR-associated protein Cse2/CasB [Neomegalonema sp.]|nr:type I-E CRISPR-associated protein Cse2/CasB [Neomegalonema sp.]